MNAVNLIPVEGRRAAGTDAPGAPFLGLLAGLLVVLLATFLFIQTRNDVAGKRSELAQVNASTAQWSASVARDMPYVSAAAHRLTQLGDVGALLQQRYDWSQLLGQIAGVMPADSQLASVSAADAGSSSTAASSSTAGTSNSGIQVSGCAGSQSAVANTMVALRRMSGVSEVTLLSSTQASPSSTKGSSSSSSATSGGSSSGCSLPVEYSLTIEFTPPTSTTALSNGSTTNSTGTTQGATSSASTGAAQ